jgi:hypothetical protein
LNRGDAETQRGKEKSEGRSMKGRERGINHERHEKHEKAEIAESYWQWRDA